MSDIQSQQDGRSDEQDIQPEYLKFVGLLAVALVIIFGVAVLAPPFFGNVVPTVLGLDSASSSGMGGVPPSAETPLVADEEVTPATGLESQTAIEGERVLHTVQEGETLDQIALIYGVPVEKIAAANNLISPQQIKAGTILVIPPPG